MINANAHKRQDAINILTNLAESKKSDIRANQDATTEEKNTAIQSIDDTLAQARNNINGANTNALVDENLEDGKQKLQRIVLSTQTKTQAKSRHCSSNRSTKVDNRPESKCYNRRKTRSP